MTGRLEGLVALITGGSQGMGESHARRFVAEGARVVVADINDELGRQLADELGESARFVHLDVTEGEQWNGAVQQTLATYGQIDVLVNNAGVFATGDIDSTPRAVWDRLIAVNLTGLYLGLATVVPQMKTQRSGSIINISSIDGLRGSEHMNAYVASKWGVTGLTKSTAVEVAEWNIRVNSVHPGRIETAMSDQLGPTRLAIPLNRGAAPDEVSSMVLYLASDESAYCTGAEFVIDGGVLAGVPHRSPEPEER